MQTEGYKLRAEKNKTLLKWNVKSMNKLKRPIRKNQQQHSEREKHNEVIMG